MKKTLKKKKKAKKKSWFKNNWWKLSIVLIILGLAIFIALYILGLDFAGLFTFSSIFNTINQTEFNNPIQDTFSCSYEFRDNTICTGNEGVADLDDGKNANCRIGYMYNNDGIWRYYDDINLGDDGKEVLRDTPEIAGTYVFRMICIDSQNRLCYDDDTIVVEDCELPPAPDYTCTDGDGGINFDVSSYCESSEFSLGYTDGCDGNIAIDWSCDNVGRCIKNYKDCPIYSTCIGGVCMYPPCSSIVSPTSQSSCNIGLCDTGSCVYIPATITTPARCGCE